MPAVSSTAGGVGTSIEMERLGSIDWGTLYLGSKGLTG